MRRASWLRLRWLPAAARAAIVAAACWRTLAIAQSQAQTAVAPQEAAPWAAMTTLLPARWPVDGAASSWTIYGLAADFEAADAVPVRALSGDWARYRPRAGTNAVFQSQRVELGARFQSWEIAATVRSDLLIRATRGAYDIVHDFKQRSTPADGSDFALGIDQAAATWAGLRAARSWALLRNEGAGTGLRLTGALSLLSLRRVQRGNAEGRVQFDAGTGYGLDVQADRQDSYRQFGGYGTRDATGSGYTTDLGLLWQPSADGFINLSAVDLLSRAKVYGVSTQQLTASSSTARLNDQGYVDYQPLLSGRYLAGTVVTTLGRKASVSAGARMNWSGTAGVWAGARWERTGRLDLPALWAALPVAAGWQLQIDAELRFRSLGIGLATRSGSILLRTRSLPLGLSHAYGWQAGCAMTL